MGCRMLISWYLTSFTWRLRDFRFSPQWRWFLRCSGSLREVKLRIDTARDSGRRKNIMISSLNRKYSLDSQEIQFVIVRTSTPKWTLSWATWAQSTHSHAIHLRSVFVLCPQVASSIGFSEYNSVCASRLDIWNLVSSILRLSSFSVLCSVLSTYLRNAKHCLLLVNIFVWQTGWTYLYITVTVRQSVRALIWWYEVCTSQFVAVSIKHSSV